MRLVVLSPYGPDTPCRPRSCHARSAPVVSVLAVNKSVFVLASNSSPNAGGRVTTSGLAPDAASLTDRLGKSQVVAITGSYRDKSSNLTGSMAFGNNSSNDALNSFCSPVKQTSGA